MTASTGTLERRGRLYSGVVEMAQNGGGKSFPAWWPTFVSLNGIALVWYEAVLANFDRPWLLALAGA